MLPAALFLVLLRERKKNFVHTEFVVIFGAALRVVKGSTLCAVC